MITSSFTPQLRDTISEYGFKMDRLTGDQLNLPNNMYGIKLKVNDLVVSETINYSLTKLYENWLYLISYSVIPSNNIPEDDYFNHMIVDTGDGFEWEYKNDFESVSSQTTGNLLDGVERVTKIQNIANPNNYNMIMSTSTNLLLLSGHGETSLNLIVNSDDPNNPIYSNSSITHPSNEIQFSNITSQVVTQDNDLFVLDGDHKTIFKFDISGILTLDKAILLNDTPGRLMTDMIGGDGELHDKTKFKNPIVMETVDNLLYVLDYNEQSTVKVYDSELNWKQSYSLSTHLSSGPIDMQYNSETNRFYVLCHTTTFYDHVVQQVDAYVQEPQLMVFDRQFNHVSTHKLIDHEKHNSDISSEKYKGFRFSIENKNIMYLLTESNVYKKYVSRPVEFIGNFLLSEKGIGTGTSSTMSFQNIFISETIVNVNTSQQMFKDEILLLDSQNQVIFQFIEDSAYEKSLETSFDQKVLYLDTLTIKDDEYVSTLTYNKTLTKHLFNNLLLLENTSRKFTTKFDVKGISRYIGFTYLTSDEIDTLRYEIKSNNYIGNNEILLTSTINRCLEQVYNLQLRIRDNMQEKPVNVYPLINVPVSLNAC